MLRQNIVRNMLAVTDRILNILSMLLCKFLSMRHMQFVEVSAFAVVVAIPLLLILCLSQ